MTPNEIALSLLADLKKIQEQLHTAAPVYPEPFKSLLEGQAQGLALATCAIAYRFEIKS